MNAQTFKLNHTSYLPFPSHYLIRRNIIHTNECEIHNIIRNPNHWFNIAERKYNNKNSNDENNERTTSICDLSYLCYVEHSRNRFALRTFLPFRCSFLFLLKCVLFNVFLILPSLAFGCWFRACVCVYLFVLLSFSYRCSKVHAWKRFL